MCKCSSCYNFSYQTPQLFRKVCIFFSVLTFPSLLTFPHQHLTMLKSLKKKHLSWSNPSYHSMIFLPSKQSQVCLYFLFSWVLCVFSLDNKIWHQLFEFLKKLFFIFNWEYTQIIDKFGIFKLLCLQVIWVFSLRI